MTLRLDFSRLTLRGALDLAITIEEEAQLRYQEFAARVADPAAAAFFKEMVANESRHRRQLEARRHVLFRHEPPRYETSLADDVEAPEPGEVPEGIGAREAMEVALRAEIRAWEFYDQALAHLADPDVKAFFAELRDEEVEHQALLRGKLARLDERAGA
ncbi:MAG: ferritin family protein [Anaeromyxobacteraceae bacterium]|nr:ferritin family protein [Anaeromyxobacteraceae bacterium]